MQRVVVVVRFGIGSVDSRSRRGTARALDMSYLRVARLERRGVRSLVRASRRSACEGGGASLVALGGMAAGGDGIFALASLATSDGLTRVRGVRESGGKAADEGPASAPAPAVATPFGDVEASPDNPLTLLLLLAVVVSAVFLARGVVHALR